MAVPYEEMQGSGKRSTNMQQDQITRIIKIAWDLQDQLIEQLFGNTLSAGASILRNNLATYPGEPYLVIQGVDFDPMPGDAPIIKNGALWYPNGAICTLKYSSMEWEITGVQSPDNPNNQAYTSVSLDIGGEIMNLPADSVEWQQANDAASTSVPDTVSAGQIIPTTKLTYTLNQWPTLPLAAIRSLRGKVNSTPFYGAAAGTVLFMGASAKRDFSSGSQAHLWTIDLVFEEKAVQDSDGTNYGWNTFFRQDPGADQFAWQVLWTQKGHNLIYQSGDLNQLFNG